MSPTNREVIRVGYAAWANRDLETWLETLHPEVEFQTSGLFPDLATTYRGHRGMRSFWKAMLVPWEAFSLDVERIAEGDDSAAVALHIRATGKGSGAPADLRQGQALRFVDGRVIRISAHPTFEEALEAAGLSE